MAKGDSKKGSRRGQTKKVTKAWYKIVAPDMFGGNVIGETLASDPQKLVGRKIEVTLQALSGDISKMHIKLMFQIKGIKGSKATTKFVSQSLTSDYLRGLIRRKKTKHDYTVKVDTIDGYTLKIKPLILTESRAKSSQNADIYHAGRRIIEEKLASETLNGVVNKVISGELASSIYRECKKIYSIKRVEIRKTEVVLGPEDQFEISEEEEEQDIEERGDEAGGQNDAAEETILERKISELEKDIEDKKAKIDEE